MNVSKAKRRLPPSSPKPTGERNKRRAGLVKGAPMARAIFGLSVTGCHADYLPLPMRRTGVGTAQSHIEEKAAGVTAIIDPVREMAPDRVRCGPGSESLGFSTRRRAPSSLRLRRLPARTYWPVDHRHLMKC